VADLEAAGDVGGEHAVAVDDGVVDRLQGGEPVPDLGHVRPRLSRVVVDQVEHQHPAVFDRPGHGAVGAPPQVGGIGDDLPVVQARLASPGGTLRGKQPVSAQQPQHPLARHVHFVLAAQPGPDLAIPLTGERRVTDHPSDQPDQLVIADRPDRSWPHTDLTVDDQPRRCRLR
jgi:hypothetical protein